MFHRRSMIGTIFTTETRGFDFLDHELWAAVSWCPGSDVSRRALDSFGSASFRISLVSLRAFVGGRLSTAVLAGASAGQAVRLLRAEHATDESLVCGSLLGSVTHLR
jgi:hypothetical protein